MFSLLFFFILPSLFLFFRFFFFFVSPPNYSDAHNHKSTPPTINYFSLYANRRRLIEWTAELVNSSPTSSIIIRRPFSLNRIMTASPAVVHHILKTKFTEYPKGEILNSTLFDLLGEGIFNADGDQWKFQRKISSHEFNTNSLRHFVEHVVDFEINERLIPILTTAAENDTVFDLQEILQRFTFDTICRISFGYDPAFLTADLPNPKFAVAFQEAVSITTERFPVVTPLLWKIKRFFNVGSEKKLKEAVTEVREFALKIVNEKKREALNESVDLLSRFIGLGYTDQNMLTDIVISFILAGRDTTSSSLTWFFWSIFNNPTAEAAIVEEAKTKSESTVYDEVKEMVYTHACLSESMRLHPPVPLDSKVASADDVLPDGTVLKKGTMVTYHAYAMGRSEELWGGDWAEYRPERWLETDETTGKMRYKAKDSYAYPVFHAGPRICLGKDMALLQMKRVVTGVLRRFKMVPAVDGGGEPELDWGLTMRMKDGFPVRIKKRNE